MDSEFKDLDLDYTSISKEGIEKVSSDILALPTNEEIKDALIYLIDNKVEHDNEVPIMLQELFHNEKFSAMLVEIENESNNS